MFAYIKGTLVNASPTAVVIDAGGIGYKIFIPSNVFQRMPQIGEAFTLHTSFVVRELAQTLYGFIIPQERDFFEALMGVTGIGPKIAMALIGHMPLHELQRAISQEDTATICRVPGIGKKGAERLIIEMRDKVGAFAVNPADFAIKLQDPRSEMINDAVTALINLGYNLMIAQKAVKKTLKDVPETVSLPDLIATSLKNI